MIIVAEVTLTNVYIHNAAVDILVPAFVHPFQAKACISPALVPLQAAHLVTSQFFHLLEKDTLAVLF